MTMVLFSKKIKKMVNRDFESRGLYEHVGQQNAFSYDMMDENFY